MSNWSNETATIPNQNVNGNGFPHMNDPNGATGPMMDPSAYMGNPAQFNPAQFNPQQQQQMAAMQNGGQMRNASPSFQNQGYQTNPVVPSKRARPREDSMAGSPRPNPGMLPTSRSETPQQFPGYQPGGMPQQNAQQPQQYPHLQSNGSGNATPSPIMGNNMRPGSVPQRVATVSPHPFSPGTQQQFNPQGSPVPSEQGTPQPNPYMQNMQHMQGMQNMPQGFNPNNASASPTPARPPSNPAAMGGMMPQQMGQQGPGQMFPPNMQQPRNAMEHQQMAAYQARLQKQLQAQGSMQNLQQQDMPQGMQNMPPNMQQQMAAQMQGQGRGMVPKQGMQQMPNGQPMPQGGMRPQQRGMSQEYFMKTLAKFMQSQGLPLDTSAVIASRPVNLAGLFQAVQGKGGHKAATGGNQWPYISHSLGFHPQQLPQAPQMLRELYERNLARFEEFWHSQQNQQRMQQGMQGQAMQQQPTPNKQMSPQQGQMSPQGQMQPTPQQQQQQQQKQPPQSQQTPAPPQQAQHQAPQHPQQAPPTPQQASQQPPHPMPGQPQTPVKQPSFSGAQPGMNGVPHPPNQMQTNTGTPVQGHMRNSISRGMDQPTAPGGPFPPQSPANAQQANPMMQPGSGMMRGQASEPPQPETEQEQLPRLVKMAQRTDQYEPDTCNIDDETFGGLNIHSLFEIGTDLEAARPDIPSLWDLGYIDIQALTRSIESGIYGEVRMALDTLATVTSGPHQFMFIELQGCEDLVDVLLECAEEQLEHLAENTVEVSDDIQLNSFEEVARACWVDEKNIRPVPEFGTAEYHLDRSVDRLCCIVTILRNLSFPRSLPPSKNNPYPEEENPNAPVLADETVIKFLCMVFRYLGTRNMLLRTYANTLEFMKDAVTLLSNIASAVEIPGREQAFCLLQFLLAFSPSSNPSLVDGKLFFHYSEPGVHTYLSSAVNALANFLARDEPNRTHYKVLFALEGSNNSSHELLTRTFGLAVSVLPLENAPEPPAIYHLIDANTPMLMQGLLAADILASLAPGHESDVAKMWLCSGSGLAEGMYHLIRSVGAMQDSAGNKRAMRDSPLPYIMSLGFSTLKRLSEKAHDPENPISIAADVVPSSLSVFKLMHLRLGDWVKDPVFKNLNGYAAASH